MKKLLRVSITILIITFMIFTNTKCGSGMIGLLINKGEISTIPVTPPDIIEPGLYNLDTMTFMGNLKAFNGNPNVISYYDYFNNTGHPIDVDMETDKMNLMIYRNGEDYYLIIQINTDINSSTVTRSVSLSMETLGNNNDDSVILSDDNLEFIQISNLDEKNEYTSIWSYTTDGDGAIVGPFKFGAKAKIIFHVYSDLQDIRFYSKTTTPYHLLNGGVATNILIEFL